MTKRNNFDEKYRVPHGCCRRGSARGIAGPSGYPRAPSMYWGTYCLRQRTLHPPTTRGPALDLPPPPPARLRPGNHGDLRAGPSSAPSIGPLRSPPGAERRGRVRPSRRHQSASGSARPQRLSVAPSPRPPLSALRCEDSSLSPPGSDTIPIAGRPPRSNAGQGGSGQPVLPGGPGSALVALSRVRPAG